MKKITFILSFFISIVTIGQTASKVDYDAFEKLVTEVKSHRAERLITLEEMQKMLNKEKDILILDTRSKAMFDAKHIEGAIHLNFSDFTADNLEALIPSKKTKIIIYCNNNIDNDEEYFPTKSYTPPPIKDERELTLALNIPTYINLFGYGYENVYELSELISIFDNRIKFEGTAVPTEE